MLFFVVNLHLVIFRKIPFIVFGWTSLGLCQWKNGSVNNETFHLLTKFCCIYISCYNFFFHEPFPRLISYSSIFCILKLSTLLLTVNAIITQIRFNLFYYWRNFFLKLTCASTQLFCSMFYLYSLKWWIPIFLCIVILINILPLISLSYGVYVTYFYRHFKFLIHMCIFHVCLYHSKRTATS